MGKIIKNFMQDELIDIRDNFSLEKLQNMDIQEISNNFFSCESDIIENPLLDRLRQLYYPFYNNGKGIDFKVEYNSSKGKKDYYLKGKRLDDASIDYQPVKLKKKLIEALTYLNITNMTEIEIKCFNNLWSNLTTAEKIFIGTINYDRLFFDYEKLLEVSNYFLQIDEKGLGFDIKKSRKLIEKLEKEFSCTIYDLMVNYHFYIKRKHDIFSFNEKNLKVEKIDLIKENDVYQVEAKLIENHHHLKRLHKEVVVNAFKYACSNKVDVNLDVSTLKGKYMVLEQKIYDDYVVFEVHKTIKSKTRKHMLRKYEKGKYPIDQFLLLVNKHKNAVINLKIYQFNEGCAKHSNREVKKHLLFKSTDSFDVILIDCFYCETCKEYFSYKEHLLNQIPNKSFENLMIKESDHHRSEAGFEWLEESFLHKLGYNVAQKEGLTETDRQYILRKIINNKIFCKIRVLAHINAQISKFERQRTSKYDTAIRKWKSDLKYVQYNFKKK